MEPEREPTTGVPRWVKLAVIVVAILAIVVVGALLLGGGQHGPRRHTGQAAPTDVIVEG